MDNEKQKLVDQIDKLEEEQVHTMMQKIDKIYEAIYGNGKEGIVTIVGKQGLIISTLCWGLGVIYVAGASYITVEIIKAFSSK
jgi:hypothetical protein